MVCLYYADIYRGAAIGYEKRNWIVVSAGYKANADFADCLTTIIDLSDCVVSQGYGSSAIYAVYREKPLLYIPSSRQIEIADKGVFEDKNEWMLPYEKMLSDLFSEYSEKLTRKQYECCSKIYGFCMGC